MRFLHSLGFCNSNRFLHPEDSKKKQQQRLLQWRMARKMRWNCHSSWRSSHLVITVSTPIAVCRDIELRLRTPEISTVVFPIVFLMLTSTGASGDRWTHKVTAGAGAIACSIPEKTPNSTEWESLSPLAWAEKWNLRSLGYVLRFR